MKRTRSATSTSKKAAPAVTAPIDDLFDPKGYEEHCIRELRGAGFRITMPRVQVIRALADSKTALSAYAIHEKIVNGGGKIDVVSVYRILSTLQEVGLIHSVGVAGGFFPVRMSDGARNTQVVMDEESRDIVELKLPDAVMTAIEKQAREQKFEISAVKVEIVGKLNA